MVHLKVTFAHRHLTLTRNVTISIDTIGIIPYACAPEVPGLLDDTISKCWLCTRVSHALLHLRQRTQMDVELHADTEITQCTNMRRSVYRHLDRSSCLLSLSPSRRILVLVNLHSCRKIKQSSKMPLPTV